MFTSFVLLSHSLSLCLLTNLFARATINSARQQQQQTDTHSHTVELVASEHLSATSQQKRLLAQMQFAHVA